VNLISNIGSVGWGGNGFIINNSYGAKLNVYTNMNYMPYLNNNKNYTYYIDLLQSTGNVIIDNNVYL
jgi:hypothetical protein